MRWPAIGAVAAVMIVAGVLLLTSLDRPRDGTSNQPPPASPASAPAGLQYYIVQPGDTLRAITDFFGVHPDDVVALNDLAPDTELVPGALLRLPPQQPQ